MPRSRQFSHDSECWVGMAVGRNTKPGNFHVFHHQSTSTFLATRGNMLSFCKMIISVRDQMRVVHLHLLHRQLFLQITPPFLPRHKKVMNYLLNWHQKQNHVHDPPKSKIISTTAQKQNSSHNPRQITIPTSFREQKKGPLLPQTVMAPSRRNPLKQGFSSLLLL